MKNKLPPGTTADINTYSANQLFKALQVNAEQAFPNETDVSGYVYHSFADSEHRVGTTSAEARYTFIIKHDGSYARRDRGGYEFPLDGFLEAMEMANNYFICQEPELN